MIPPVKSKALEVNLQRTAIDVVIPQEHFILLEITKKLYGVQQETEKLLKEINHAFVGWKQTIEDLHYRAMGDFFHYNAHPQGADGLELFCTFYLKAAKETKEPAIREVAIRYWLYFLEKIALDSGEMLARNSQAIAYSIKELEFIFEDDRGAMCSMIASPRLRRLAKTLKKKSAKDENLSAVLEQSLTILKKVYRTTYQTWKKESDALSWFRESISEADCAQTNEPCTIVLPNPLPDVLEKISKSSLEANLEALDSFDSADKNDSNVQDRLLKLVDHGEIVRSYIDAASYVEDKNREAWRNTLARIHWMSRVLGCRLLTPVHENALHEISRSYSTLLQNGDRDQLMHFVHQTFAILRKTDFENPLPVLDLITTIGVEVMKTKDEEWIDAVIDEILELDFQYPRFSGFTNEWQVRINPGHLKNIRTYLALIKEAPPLARRLIAALIVQLRIGGVFIADTDLFQKDISELLNSDIKWTYGLVKHLCKLFPVYFSDIGAEGELRDVSTRLDEARKRKDLLCHFLRKQCHIEANPKLILFTEEAIRFLATGNAEPLAPYLPPSIYESLDVEKETHQGMHQIFAAILKEIDFDALLKLKNEDLYQIIEKAGQNVDPIDRERAELLVRVRHLVGKKYEIDHSDVIERLHEFHRIDSHHVRALERALEKERPREALALVLEILERLKKIILSPDKTEGVEDIYHKRHVAVGIPSMYGRYREEKFEAMGLTFRVESLANALYEKMLSNQNLRYITKTTLQRVAVWLRMLLRALRIDGFRARGLELRIWMLEQALQARGITVDQYINIFQMLSNSIKHLIRKRFIDTYETVLDELGVKMQKAGLFENEQNNWSILSLGESFLRDKIADSFGLQRLDNLVGTIINTLRDERENLDIDTLNLLMTYDVDRCFVQLEQEGTPLNGHIYLGNKGFMLKRLAHYGFPVPHGFILTTEVFRCRKAIVAHPELSDEHIKRIHKQIKRLEALTGNRFGDPKNPLLLSVRSGAAMSMPGMLDSFLNVGMNEEITEGFAQARDCPWGAWDAYRRFLQFWGMSFGVNRDQFDKLMRNAKLEASADKKSHLRPEQMKALALKYKDLVYAHRIKIPEDPYEQLAKCTELVLNSWSSSKAKIYRQALHIAEEWGTAVIVQQMVYGNLTERSGTGVVFTRHPWQSGDDDVALYGDFVIQGQGDDVVSGLVDTFPITEEQRIGEKRKTSVSLEKDYPEIFKALAKHAKSLLHDVGMYHQEIEFTFEGDQPDNLYVLQSRDIVLSQSTHISTFVPTEKLNESMVASGIGVGGGAVSGRVAHTYSDITTLRRSYPDDNVILIRPDTVPDDIHMVLEANGLLTCIGGATSHAAVASQRIGVACVVGCQALDVDDENGQSRLGDHIIKTGDCISINGQDGSVYLGNHEITKMRH